MWAQIPVCLSSGWPLSSFAPLEIISQILDDRLDRFHPVAPVIIRGRFMRRLESKEAEINPVFCALVISVCAAAKATLPRENYGEINISTCVEFIDKYRILTRSHIRSSYTLYWCITMYNSDVPFTQAQSVG